MVDRIGGKFVARCLEDLGRRSAVIGEHFENHEI
jgi:hypothetical protein